MKRSIIFALLFTGIILRSSFSQTASDSVTRTGIMNVNNIKAIIKNNGILGQPNDIGPTVSWKYEHNGYFNDISVCVGVELPVKDYSGDGIPDTVHEVIFTPVIRPGGGNNNSIENGFGGFEPAPGYFNPNLNKPGEGVAINNLPDTWPSEWPDHPEYGQNSWNGFFGKDSSAGDQEAYFVMNDRNDAKYYKLYSFLPDPADTTRYGFGITVKVRYIELKDPMFRDVIFRVYDIRNESRFNYSKIVFGNLTGTYIGGAGDEYNDDVSYFDSSNSVIFSWDREPGKNIPYVRPEANPDWYPNPYSVGTTGEAFIQSPDNNRIGSCDIFYPAGNIVMNRSEDMWKRLTSFTKGSRASDSLHGEDGDYIYGSRIFPLDSGETKRIATVLAFGNDKYDVYSKIQLARMLWNNNFNIKDISDAVSFTEPLYHQTFKGDEIIRWSSKSSGGTVDLWFSPDAGKTWTNVARNAPNTGSYLWNTSLNNDCSFGLLKIYFNDNNGNVTGFDERNYFSINNTGNSNPFVKILDPEFKPDTVITGVSQNFNLLIGDNKKDSLLCRVYYKTSGDTNYYLSQAFYVRPDTQQQTVKINFENIVNSMLLKIKIEVSDGSISCSDGTPYFSKQTPRQDFDSTDYGKISGLSHVKIKIIKAVPDSTTGDGYRITFDDTSSVTQKTFSVYDLYTNSYKLKNVPLIPYTESPVFDGLSLYTEDFETNLDSIRSRWNHADTNNLTYSYSQLIINYTTFQIKSINYPLDYMIVFSDTFDNYSNSLSKVLGSLALKTIKVNFKIYDITNPTTPFPVQFGMTESRNNKKDTLSDSDLIFLSNSDGTKLSWRILFRGKENANVPLGGDTLFLYTNKGLSFLDTLMIFGRTTAIQPGINLPLNFSLEQNYPNPFNPSTTIEYTVPVAGNVSLTIYDILGRIVAVPVNRRQSAGRYSVKFNAGRFASGVYFYRLKAGKYVSVKKMLLLK